MPVHDGKSMTPSSRITNPPLPETQPISPEAPIEGSQSNVLVDERTKVCW
jgi:hypothetical protein